MCGPFDGDPEDTILSFSRQSDFKVYLFLTNGQRISNVQVAPTVEARLFGSKNAAVGVDHGFNDVTVYFSWAFVRDNTDAVVVNEASWHIDLNMICSEEDGAALTANIGATWTVKDRWALR